jgi:hypothetical protein
MRVTILDVWYRYKPTLLETSVYQVHKFYPKYVPGAYLLPQVCTEYVLYAVSSFMDEFNN